MVNKTAAKQRSQRYSWSRFQHSKWAAKKITTGDSPWKYCMVVEQRFLIYRYNLVVCYNPHISGQYSLLYIIYIPYTYTLNNQGPFFDCSNGFGMTFHNATPCDPHLSHSFCPQGFDPFDLEKWWLAFGEPKFTVLLFGALTKKLW